MGIFTDREKQILQHLHEGEKTSEIASILKMSQTSVSRALKNIRIKAIDIEKDIEFMLEIGYIQIKGNKIIFKSEDKNPKAIGK